MKFSKLLHDMAAHSPKHFAAIILKRNVSLRKRLMLLEPYIGKNLDDDLPDDIFDRATVTTDIGCPHCKDCDFCIWTKFTGHPYASCCEVRFDGITLRTVSDSARSLQLGYEEESEYLSIDTVRFTREEFERILRFIDAHIAWAKLPEWGTKYRETNETKQITSQNCCT